ncbi:acyl-CoA dehydrogenase family protein [Sphingomonas oryzagri]
MFFDLDEDQRSLGSMIRAFLEEALPEHLLVNRIEAEDNATSEADLFRKLCVELDVLSAAVPVSRGGSGAGLVALFVIFREMGRVLYGGPFLSSLLAAEALVAVDPDGEHDELLQALLTGRAQGAVVGISDDEGGGLDVTQNDGAYFLTGSLPLVIGGASADTLIIFADTAEETTCFALDDMTRVARHAALPLDLSRPIAALQLDRVPARRIDKPGLAATARTRLSEVASLCIAAEQVGIAERALEMAVDHAKLRRQFGVPIGSFQAVKHRCADSAVAVEAALSMALHAAWSLEGGVDPDKPMASLAKAACVEASVKVTASTIQVFGGLGFTWEHPIHLYYRRAVASRQYFGSTRAHRERIAADMLDHA